MFEKKPKIVNLQLIDDILSKQGSSKRNKLKKAEKSEIRKNEKKINVNEPGEDIPWL